MKYRFLKRFLMLWAMAAQCTGTPSVAFELDIGKTYGMTVPGIARAIEAARRDFASRPNDTVVLNIAAGRYDLSREPIVGRGVINVSDIHPGDRGRLIIRGAGDGRTVLIFDKNAAWIYGTGVYHVSFVGLSMTASEYTISQGHVVSVVPGSVVLAIEDGFPSPGELFNSGKLSGRFLRRYTDSADDPHLVQDDNHQVAWSHAERISRNNWRVFLNDPEFKPHYRPGDFVCIKSKPNGSAYWFFGGNDITFDDVVWTQLALGVFRGGLSNIHIVNSSIARAAPIRGHVPCLSTPSGGPQIVGLPNAPTKGDVVENNTFVATGDDSVAYFYASGTIRNNRISDSFARCVLLVQSPGVQLLDNQLNRCPVLRR